MTEIQKEMLSETITKTINRHARNASRQEICAFFAQECIEILDDLKWLPQNLQEAKKSFLVAKRHLTP